jgi:rubrerythrin
VPVPIDFSKLSPGDILDIAAFIEHEAQERYELFADHLDGVGERDAAAFFRRMAELEAAHGSELSTRRITRFSDLAPHVRDAVVWDVEGPPLDRSRIHLSVPEAVAIAIASEERARDFYAEALEHLVDPQVSAVLEELRADEVGHIRLLEEQRASLKAP